MGKKKKKKRFVTMFTVRHLSVSWERCIESASSHPVYLRFILILSSYVCLHFPSDLLHSTYIYRLSHSCYVPRPFHIHFDYNNWVYTEMSTVNLLARWVTISFSRMILLHGVSSLVEYIFFFFFLIIPYAFFRRWILFLFMDPLDIW
jgi:hypothetical protein